MPTSSADAQWDGLLRDGAGTMRFGNGAYEGRYSFTGRFEDGTGTNPEELVAAAAAGCFSMALSGALGAAGHAVERVRTSAGVTMDKDGDGFSITGVALRTEAVVPGLADDEFQRVAEDVKRTCPVARLLTGAPVTLDARLASG